MASVAEEVVLQGVAPFVRFVRQLDSTILKRRKDNNHQREPRQREMHAGRKRKVRIIPHSGNNLRESLCPSKQPGQFLLFPEIIRGKI